MATSDRAVQQPSRKVAAYQRMYPEAGATAGDDAPQSGRDRVAAGRRRFAAPAQASPSLRRSAEQMDARDGWPPDVIAFGKFKGRPLDDLARDPDYCDWLRRQEWIGGERDVAQWLGDHPEASALSRAAAGQAAGDLEVAARYEYRDEAGKLRYTVIRYAPKAFAIEAPDGSPLPDPVPAGLAVLYRLPELLAAPPGSTVHVCEGEKDADNVAALGLLAVSNPCGTRMGWRDAYTPFLAGRHAVILPDADGPGRKHAEKVTEALEGTALSVVTCDLHEGKRGPWDVSDWLLRDGLGAEGLARRTTAARYAAAGREPGNARPSKTDREDLVFSSRLGSTARLVLLAACYLQSWRDGGAWPSASEIGAAAGLHRVTVQREVGQLRDLGALRRDGSGIAWDILALS